ncbi:hypothetical protein QR98_0071190 [Sarcoptes scabiei]|nr:hypothetical protein QR98_0071190 [Sarcoptes scabiei]
MIVCQSDLIQAQQPNGPNNNGMNNINEVPNNNENLGGLIDVDVHRTPNGGKHVGVHIPSVYEMDLDKEMNRVNLGLRLFQGLINVRVDDQPRIKRKHKLLMLALASLPIWNQQSYQSGYSY